MEVLPPEHYMYSSVSASSSCPRYIVLRLPNGDDHPGRPSWADTSLRDFMVPQNNHCQRFYHPPSQITGCWGVLVPASKEQSSSCLLDRLRQSGGTCRDSWFGVTTLDDTTRVFQIIISCLSVTLSKHIEHGEHTFSCLWSGIGVVGTMWSRSPKEQNRPQQHIKLWYQMDPGSPSFEC